MPQKTFSDIEKEFIEVLNHYEIPSDSLEIYKKGIANINFTNTATYKFRLLLNDLKIQQTQEIKSLIKRVRNTLVHDAELKEYSDDLLLSVPLIAPFVTVCYC